MYCSAAGMGRLLTLMLAMSQAETRREDWLTLIEGFLHDNLKASNLFPELYVALVYGNEKSYSDETQPRCGVFIHTLNAVLDADHEYVCLGLEVLLRVKLSNYSEFLYLYSSQLYFMVITSNNTPPALKFYALNVFISNTTRPDCNVPYKLKLVVAGHSWWQP